jgi:hypothetical protein
MSVEIRPFVADFLREAGHTVTTRPLCVEGDALSIDVSVRHDAIFAVDVEARYTGRTRLLTPEPRVLEAFLVTGVAGAWREAHGLRRLRDSSLRSPRTHVVVQDPDGFVIRRRSDGAWVGTCSSSTDAARLASALDHPVETLVAAAKENQGRPVWTGSTLAPLVRGLVMTLVLVGTVAVIKVSRHAGSWEFVLGTSLGVLVAVVGATWLVVRMRRGRRLIHDALDRARPGAPTWRCLTGPGFAADMTALGVVGRLPARQVEVTLVEAPTGLELWRGGGAEPLLHLPWRTIASVDVEPVPASPVCVLALRTTRGGRVRVILMRDPAGSQRGATAQVTEEYAAHLRQRSQSLA